MTRKIEEALQELNSRVEAGAEYADAFWKVTEKFRLNENQCNDLSKAYDEQ